MSVMIWEKQMDVDMLKVKRNIMEREQPRSGYARREHDREKHDLARQIERAEAEIEWCRLRASLMTPRYTNGNID